MSWKSDMDLYSPVDAVPRYVCGAGIDKYVPTLLVPYMHVINVRANSESRTRR